MFLLSCFAFTEHVLLQVAAVLKVLGEIFEKKKNSNLPHENVRFWYQKNAHIFLITIVKF